MVDNSEWISADDTAQMLGITINNLRQIQFRGNLKWVKREGRKVFYLLEQVLAYAEKRNKRKNKKNQSNSEYSFG
jgi:predicted site-specific integrase-resolvase